MLTPEPAPLLYLDYLDRVLALVAPQWALRRARARAAHAALTAQLEADRRAPRRVRWIDGERWVSVDPPPGTPTHAGGWKLEPYR
jgi:hypothetical protein